MIVALFALLAVAALTCVSVRSAGRADRYEAALKEIAAASDINSGTVKRLARIAQEALR